MLNPSDRGEMIVVKHGRREMQLAWTHLLPATFGGRARMNVQNSLAAAAAAFAAGAPLHDIRQGLRTFSTNYYLSPGRLNEVEVNGVNVIVDYCHNAPGHARCSATSSTGSARRLTSTSELGKPSRIGVDRHRRRPARRGHASSSARSPPQHFDVVIVREDDNLRGRARGETAGLVAEGVRQAMADGARCKQVEIVLDEIEAVRHAMARANRRRPRRGLRRQARRGDERAGELVDVRPGRRRARTPTPRRPTPTTPRPRARDPGLGHGTAASRRLNGVRERVRLATPAEAEREARSVPAAGGGTDDSASTRTPRAAARATTATSSTAGSRNRVLTWSPATDGTTSSRSSSRASPSSRQIAPRTVHLGRTAYVGAVMTVGEEFRQRALGRQVAFPGRDPLRLAQRGLQRAAAPRGSRPAAPGSRDLEKVPT